MKVTLLSSSGDAPSRLASLSKYSAGSESSGVPLMNRVPGPVTPNLSALFLKLAIKSLNRCQNSWIFSRFFVITNHMYRLKFQLTFHGRSNLCKLRAKVFPAFLCCDVQRLLPRKFEESPCLLLLPKLSAPQSYPIEPRSKVRQPSKF